MKRLLRTLAICGILAGSIGVPLAEPAAAAGVVDIHVGSFYYEDATVGDGVIRANVGDQLRFTFDDNGGHTADVDALGIHTGKQAQGAVVVTAPLTTPGTYELYCTPHRRRGQLTTLIVSGEVATTTTTTNAPTTTTTAAATTTQAPTTTAAGSTTTAGGESTSTTQAGQETSTSTTTGGATSTSPTTSAGTATSNTESGDPADPTIAQETDVTTSEDIDKSEELTGEGEPDAFPFTDDSMTESASSESADVLESSVELLPVGVTEPDGKPWLRSVWVGLLSLVPITGITIVAGTRARRLSLRSD
jgi:plastocyanin